MNTVPTEADWRSVPWDLDLPYAYEHFSGKSIEQSVPLFVENALCYQEEVSSMPAPCLRYYIQAYIAYLMSDASQHDPDGASCFLGLVRHRMPDLKNAEQNVVDVVVAALRHIADRQEWYDAAEWIYGDFKSQASELIDKLQA
jgi:hypothetical protein